MRKKGRSTKPRSWPSVRLNVVKAVRPLLNRPYKLGGNGADIGDPFDCFGLMVEYIYYRYGLKLFDYHSKEEFDFHGYHNDFEALKETKKEELLAYLKKCFLSVRINYMMGGDLLYCESDGVVFVGVYCGSQRMIITTPETGCITVGTEHYNIKDAFRCPLPSR